MHVENGFARFGWRKRLQIGAGLGEVARRLDSQPKRAIPIQVGQDKRSSLAAERLSQAGIGIRAAFDREIADWQHRFGVGDSASNRAQSFQGEKHPLIDSDRGSVDRRIAIGGNPQIDARSGNIEESADAGGIGARRRFAAGRERRQAIDPSVGDRLAVRPHDMRLQKVTRLQREVDASRIRQRTRIGVALQGRRPAFLQREQRDGQTAALARNAQIIMPIVVGLSARGFAKRRGQHSGAGDRRPVGRCHTPGEPPSARIVFERIGWAPIFFARQFNIHARQALPPGKDQRRTRFQDIAHSRCANFGGRQAAYAFKAQPPVGTGLALSVVDPVVLVHVYPGAFERILLFVVDEHLDRASRGEGVVKRRFRAFAACLRQSALGHIAGRRSARDDAACGQTFQPVAPIRAGLRGQRLAGPAVRGFDGRSRDRIACLGVGHAAAEDHSRRKRKPYRAMPHSRGERDFAGLVRRLMRAQRAKPRLNAAFARRKAIDLE
ncbi:MAG: hypothetical protein BWZ10_01901 [candidate division BRC1 bacterium ADurb.BinA364]|nr:MAG: hypothetical protein BWZ10_01901 [candidate division BRC1 bacterium ADurb.BinA364]